MFRALRQTSARFAFAILSGVVAFAQTNTPAYRIYTVAGGGLPENIPATSADLGPISAMAVDSAGNIYLALTDFNLIERVGPDGVLARVAGNGTSGFGGDGGPATNALLSQVIALAVSPSGDLYISDSSSQRIRKVSNGIITTVAGGGTQPPGSAPLPATSVSLPTPGFLTFDANGDLVFAVLSSTLLKLSNDTITQLPFNAQGSISGLAADTNGGLYVSIGTYFPKVGSNGNVISFPGNQVVLPGVLAPIATDANGVLYYLGSGVVFKAGSTAAVAGNGGQATSGDGGLATQASLNQPEQIAFDGQNNLYILQKGDNRVRKVSNGIITTVAGTQKAALLGDEGPAFGARLFAEGTAFAPDGSLYVADTLHNRIRKITNGIITTFAGTGEAGYTGDGGPATAARLNIPQGVAVDNAGNVYVADTENVVIRKITGGQITTVATHTGPASGVYSVVVNASGTLFVSTAVGAHQVVNGTWNASLNLFGQPIFGTIAMDSAGNIYAPGPQGQILKWSNGTVSVVGTLPQPYQGFFPTVSQDGTLYILAADLADSTLSQKIFSVANGVATPIAGGGTDTGEGVPALSAAIPNGYIGTVDQAGRVYMSNNGAIRVLVPDNVAPPPGATVTSNNCVYTLGPAAESFAAAGGTGTISINTGPGCVWGVGSVPAGVILTSGLLGTGPGTVSFQMLPNSGPSAKASFLVAGQNFVVEQESPSLAGMAMAGSLAQVATGGGWIFTQNLVNLGSSSATARLNFSDNSGNPLSIPLTFPQAGSAAGLEVGATLERAINPNAQGIVQSAGSADAQIVTGSAQVQAAGEVSGFGIFSYPALGWNAVVPLETRNAAKYYLAFDNTGQLATGIAIANLKGSAAGVGVVIRDDTGIQIGTGTINLAPIGHSTFMLSDPQLGFAATSGKRGTIEFDTPSGGQISVLGMRANGRALTTLPVLASSDPAGGAIAHTAYNSGFTSAFYFVNTGSASAQLTLSLFSESGIPVSVPLMLPQTETKTTTSVLMQTLAPGAMLVVETAADDQAPSVVGSAQLTTTGSVGGFEVFRWTTFGQEASVPLETRAPGSYLLMFDHTNGLTTGVALSNVGDLPTIVPVKIFDDAGNLLASSTINLAGRGHTSFMLPDNYPTTVNRRGMVEFVPAGGKITAIGMRATSDGLLTTIPVLVR